MTFHPLLRLARPLGLWLGSACIAMAQTTPPSNVPQADDPYLWLEEVQGARALDWVRERNATSRALLQAEPHFAPTRERLRAILDAKDRIPAVQRRGDWLYNFWRDDRNPRGLWRRTTLAEFAKPQAAWHTVLDLDALARSDNENWVWHGADCLGPTYQRCLLSLSRGGADASVIREFDSVTGRFVADGFVLPEAKSDIAWLDADTLLVATDFGPGSMTDSGYPRVVKRWQRGQPLASAVTVFEGEKQDVGVGISVDMSSGRPRVLLQRSLDFYRSRQWLLQGKRLLPLDKPEHARLQFWGRHLLLQPREDWTVDGRRHPGGSLLLADAKAYLAGQRRFTVLFEPTPTRSLAGWALTRDHVLLQLLDNVAGRLQEWRRGPRGFTHRDVAAPFPGQLSVQALHDPWQRQDPLAERYLLNYTDFLRPDTLFLGRSGSDERSPLKALPAQYDSTGLSAEQFFATSRDGTRVPYFVVRRVGATGAPTLLYGYGGFEVPLLPRYSPGVGSAWTSQGGTYVVANIRGGGEFGPAWHRAALLENRQRAFDDFIAVAEDLIARGITTPQRLGLMGGSNGGLLVGAVMLQRPELFGAVVCQVPLLDMKRYHLLLAGASWMAEYGNPDLPEQWAFISAYSPYQNVRPGMKLPPLLLTTSTRDDRVHPGHARKMAARMQAQGHDVQYYENMEGGHGGAADNAQRADLLALEYSFLWRVLSR
ncbi:serine protease, S9A family peptidase [Burkholderiales bacterium JOSHI_001]|nr:serine protease, S9A family peptidase [Burkholderiales bacterium JOSHI_001]